VVIVEIPYLAAVRIEIPEFADAEIPEITATGLELRNSPNPPSSLILTRNGLVLKAGAGGDYDVSGNSITWAPGCEPLDPADLIQAWYRY
jgi:hypothetical protein